MTHTLAKYYPWPAEKPNVPLDPFELWLHPGGKDLFAKRLNDQTKIVVECGSWLGDGSTKFILKHAPNAILICSERCWRL
jgi:hypothetical protein